MSPQGRLALAYWIAALLLALAYALAFPWLMLRLGPAARLLSFIQVGLIALASGTWPALAAAAANVLLNLLLHQWHHLSWEGGALGPMMQLLVAALIGRLRDQDMIIRRQLEQMRHSERESRLAAAELEKAVEHANRLTVESELTSLELNEVFNAARDAMVVIGRDFRVMRVNEPYADLAGVDALEAVGQKCHQLFGHPLCHTQGCVLDRVMQSGQALKEEVSLKDPKGRECSFLLTGSPIRRFKGEFIGVVEGLHNITERKKLERRLRVMANTDGLTGVHNRRHFLELAEREIQRSGRYRTSLCLVLIDLDNFKKVNDRFGHPVGDNMLRHFCSLCQEELRASDILGRVGGEEFAIVLVECDLAGAALVAERIRARLERRPWWHNGRRVPCTLSAGVAQLDGEKDTIDALLSRSDQALYRAKDKGRNRVESEI